MRHRAQSHAQRRLSFRALACIDRVYPNRSRYYGNRCSASCNVQGADAWIHRDEGHSHASRKRPFRAVVVRAHS
eukprot:4147369-Prymnesium_polylepis.1